MKDKHLDYAIQYGKIHGKYPPYIHRHLAGGNIFDDFFNGVGEIFKSFGRDMGQAFTTLGDFVNSHMDIFEGLLVTSLMCFFFPELAGGFLVDEAFNLTQQIVAGSAASHPANAGPPPTKEDVQKAVDAFKADPRFQSQITKPLQDFIKFWNNYTQQSPAYVQAANLWSYYDCNGTTIYPVMEGEQMYLVLKDLKTGIEYSTRAKVDINPAAFSIKIWNERTNIEYNGPNEIQVFQADYNGWWSYCVSRWQGGSSQNMLANLFSPVTRIFMAISQPVIRGDVPASVYYGKDVYPYIQNIMNTNGLPKSPNLNDR